MSKEEEPGMDEHEPEHEDHNEEPEELEKHSVGDIFGDLWKRFPLFGAIVVFIIFIVINTDFFINNVLAKKESLVSDGQVTSSGVFVQGFLLVLLYVIFDIMHKAKLI
jgi:hypothetical protein